MTSIAMSGPVLPQILQRLVTAVNAGDTPGFLACFAADGMVDDRSHALRRIFTGDSSFSFQMRDGLIADMKITG